jgi:hypothetical protein
LSSFGFNGSTGYIALPAAGIVTTFPASVEAWVYIPNVTCKGAIIKLGDGTHGWGMGLGKGTANCWDNAGTSAVYLSGLFEGIAWLFTSSSGTADPLTVGWNHCAMTVDSAINSYAVTFYVNGVSFANANAGHTPNAPSGNYSIGADGGSSRFFCGEAGGRLAYCAVYNGVLSAARVSAHYAAASGAAYISAVLADTPTGFWELQDSTTGTPADSSGNNHSATGNGVLTANLLGPFDIVAVVPKRHMVPKFKPVIRKPRPLRRRIWDGSLVLSPVPPRHKKLKTVPKKAPAKRPFRPFRFSQFVAVAPLAMVPKRHKPLRYPLVLQATRPPRRLRFPRRVIGYNATIYTQSLAATNTTTAAVVQLLKTTLVVTNTTAGTMGQFINRTVSATMATVGTVAQFIQQAVSATNTTTATVALQQIVGFVLGAANTTTATVGQLLTTTFAVTNTTTGQVIQSVQAKLRAINVTRASIAVQTLHTFLITLAAHVTTAALSFLSVNSIIKPYTIEITKVTSVTSITVTNVRKVS